MNRNLLCFVLLTSCFINTAKADVSVFTTFEDAVVSALNEADTVAPNAEAGGAIYQCLGKFTYLPPVTQNEKRGLEIMVGETAECKLAGLYHTHPKNDRNFSKIDMNGACKFGVPSVMRPKGGQPRLFTCPSIALTALSREQVDFLATGKNL